MPDRHSIPAHPRSTAKATRLSQCSPAAAVTSTASPITRAATPRSAMWMTRPGIALVGDDEVAAAAQDHEGARRAAPAQSTASASAGGVVHADVVAGAARPPRGW